MLKLANSFADTKLIVSLGKIKRKFFGFLLFQQFKDTKEF